MRRFSHSSVSLFLLAILLLLLIQPDAARSADTTPTPTATASPRSNTGHDNKLCVALASDSNGYGHVTYQIPEGQVAISYVIQLWIPMQKALIDVGLTDYAVVDGSLSAGALTGIDATSYLDSVPYATVLAAHCAVVTVGPFMPDVAAGKAQPRDYILKLRQMIGALVAATPDSKILILNYYYTRRADFTVSNSGAGMTAERIAAFNAALAEACGFDAKLGSIPQVVCIDTTLFFDGMTESYVLGVTSKADYDASFYRRNRYTPLIDDYWAQHPDGALIGDGIHLSLAGRIRFTQELAKAVAAALGRNP